MAGVSLTLGYGIVKTSLVGMQTNAIVHTSLKEQDLIHTVRTTLGDETQCKKNLKPSLPTAGTKKTVSEIKKYGSDDSITSDDVSLIKATENFKNNPLIYVQKMELEVTTSDRTFILYYKKPQLGSLSSPGTCTATDQTGCYFIACKMNYACSDSANACPSSSTLNVCSPLNCAEGGAVAGGVSTEQVTTIIKEEFKKDAQFDCESGKFAKGFKEDATTQELKIDCDTPPDSQLTLPVRECPAGEFLYKVNANGTTECRPACGGGQKMFRKIQYKYKRWMPVVPSFDDNSDGSYTDTYAVNNRQDDYFNDLLSDDCSRRELHLVDPPEPCITVLEDSRFCKCPNDSTKWVQADSKCMTCTGLGHYWQAVGNAFQCKCQSGINPKKKVVA